MIECVRCKSKNVAKSLGRVAYYCRDCGFRWTADGEWTSDGKAINVDMNPKTHKLILPSLQELEDMIDYISTKQKMNQLDDFMDKADKLNNFLKKYIYDNN